MKRSEAVLQGAPLVHAMESAALAYVRATAEATLGLIDLREQVKVSPLLAEKAWTLLATATAKSHDGLASTLAFHREMTEVQARMGCRTVATGGEDKDEHDIVMPAPMGAATVHPLRPAA